MLSCHACGELWRLDLSTMATWPSAIRGDPGVDAIAFNSDR